MRHLVAAMFALFTLGAAVAEAQDVTGAWQGTLQTGRALRMVVRISNAGGNLAAVLLSIDQGAPPIAATVALQGTSIRLTIPAIGGGYEGTLSADGNTIAGTFEQGGMRLPLNLTRATPETTWAIPAPPPALAPMAPGADPSFEVATIKPSDPNAQGKLFTLRGRQVVTINTTVSDLIAFAYQLHPQQIAGGPGWLASDKYDVTGLPDAEGVPNAVQLRTLVEKLLRDRFRLTVHREKKELSAYALVVGSNGSKLTRSAGDPNGLPGIFFPRLGVMPARNATMADVANVMQSVVLDRPVVDQTGLSGRYDFTLNWTPDESQFASMGVRAAAPTPDPAAPPGLFTAVQEQLGLKFDSRKLPVDVIVIDRVERPSAN